VIVRVRRLKGHTWAFRYAVHNTGIVPISGFELNSARANLFQISSTPNWPSVGAGVCGGKFPGILIYWSTGSKNVGVIRPGQTAHFAFRVNTGGASTALYSLSWDGASAQFGRVAAPAPSHLAATGRCR
jgi:hypothetical protein